MGLGWLLEFPDQVNSQAISEFFCPGVRLDQKPKMLANIEILREEENQWVFEFLNDSGI